ncbi:hypothetical protein Bca4012_066573 [Brassica carinata]
MYLNHSIEGLHNHSGDRGNSVSFRHTVSSPAFDYYISSSHPWKKQRWRKQPYGHSCHPELPHGGTRTHRRQISSSSTANPKLIHSLKHHHSYPELIHGGSSSSPSSNPKFIHSLKQNESVIKRKDENQRSFD